MMFWVASDLATVSSSVLISSGLALGDSVALVLVETKSRQGPDIDFSGLYWLTLDLAGLVHY